MKSNWNSRIAVLFSCLICCGASALNLAAQDQPTQDQTPQSQPAQEPASRRLWSWLKEGSLSFNARWRLEGFDRDGAPFTGTAFAPTLRLALGYETPAFHGLSLFAQGEAVIVTGPADYNVPLLPSQDRPDRPIILDPRSLLMNQGDLKYVHSISTKKLAVTIGRQEIALNDGRFLSYSVWRQVHASFDAARLDVELPKNFSFTYAFINRFYREDSDRATDGEEPMHSDMMNLQWSKPGKINASLYGLLLGFSRERAICKFHADLWFAIGPVPISSTLTGACYTSPSTPSR